MEKQILAKKSLGQHFLIDHNIAKKIVEALDDQKKIKIIEIGPGKGILTTYLLQKYDQKNIFLIEIDLQCINYLSNKYNHLLNHTQIIHTDFLTYPFSKITIPNEKIKLIGNLPYNIASPIFFKILENKHQVDEVVCMIQKEVAERIISPPGSKKYGILSVLLGTFFTIKLLFTVPPQCFSPIPKVFSAVIQLKRNQRTTLDCEESFFFQIVKKSFQQRRKKLKNTLKEWIIEKNNNQSMDIFDKRPEQLSINEFIDLAKYLYQKK